MTTDNILSHGLAYANRGWPVFPVHGVRGDGACTCGKSGCQRVGKHPWTKNGLKDATTDQATIRSLFADKPGANIGIVTGTISGLLVVDWDPRNGGERPPMLPETMEVLTGGGGGHIYFRLSEPARSKSDVMPGIDIKADGGYVVAPPSRHASGRGYEWEVNHHYEEVEVADVPAEVLALLNPNQVPTPVSESRTYREGGRNEFLTSIAGFLRQKGIGEARIAEHLLLLNSSSCAPPLQEGEVIGIAKSISRYEPGADTSTKTALMLRASDADETPIEWLWDGRIPLGYMVGIEGDPGVGKSTVTCRIAAAVTRGVSLIDSLTPCNTPRDVIFLSAEDDPGQVMKGRLREAGADLDRVHFMLGLVARDSQDTEPEGLVTLMDLGVIEEQLERLTPALLVIDPLQAYFPSGVDMNRANETRPILTRLGHVLKRCGTSAIIVRHLSKSSKGENGVHRGLGSMDISGAIRSLLSVSNHPDDIDDEGRRVIIHTKSNYGPRAQTIGFSFDDDGFRWDGVLPEIRESDARASEVSTPRRPRPAGHVRKSCRDWLEDTLRDGPKSKKEIEAACEFSSETLSRAADQLGVQKIKQKGFAGTSMWYPPHWEIPKDTGTDMMDGNTDKPRENPSSHHEVNFHETGADMMVDDPSGNTQESLAEDASDWAGDPNRSPQSDSCREAASA
jgi:KaiC/GvpD/RAD55 family RecA-like ATPase